MDATALRPTERIQRPGRTQDWIKLGGKVKATATGATRAHGRH